MILRQKHYNEIRINLTFLVLLYSDIVTQHILILCYKKCLDKPVVYADKEQIEVYPYTSNATLVCTYDGYPTRMQWMRGNLELPPDPTMPGRFRKLTGAQLDSGKRVSVLNISMVLPEDIGLYTCVGNNEFGTAQRNVLVKRTFFHK